MRAKFDGAWFCCRGDATYCCGCCCHVNSTDFHHSHERPVAGPDTDGKHRRVRDIAGMASDRSVHRCRGNRWLPRDANNLQHAGGRRAASSQQFQRPRGQTHFAPIRISCLQRITSRSFHSQSLLSAYCLRDGVTQDFGRRFPSFVQCHSVDHKSQCRKDHIFQNCKVICLFQRGIRR